MLFMGRQSYKSIAKFRETLFQTNFLVNNLNFYIILSFYIILTKLW